MIELTIAQRKNIAPMFAASNDSAILSCLSGWMGSAWADDVDEPKTARIIVGDFCFLAGLPCEAYIEGAGGTMVLVPVTPGWDEMIERMYAGRCRKITRFAMQKTREGFDMESLERLSRTLPEGIQLHSVAGVWYERALAEEWSRDLCSNFASEAEFAARALGFCAAEGERIVAGASSFSAWPDGIEIQVTTRKDRRKMGLATACAAKLTLECLKAGKIPSWDAAHETSLRLAEKLGYRLAYAYTAYEMEESKHECY